jgi:hypothetical protein
VLSDLLLQTFLMRRLLPLIQAQRTTNCVP